MPRKLGAWRSRHVDGERKTMAVAHRHDFAAFTAASRANGGAPFFAELKLASMNPSERSSLPRCLRRGLAARARGRPSVATLETGDDTFDRADSVAASRATAPPCAAPRARRSAPRG